jgi:hypothetical protein
MRRICGALAAALYSCHLRFGLLRWHIPAVVEDYLHCWAYPDD